MKDRRLPSWRRRLLAPLAVYLAVFAVIAAVSRRARNAGLHGQAT